MKKSFLYLIAFAIMLTFNSTTKALADNYQSYDQNVIRAYKTLKIDILKPDIVLQSQATQEDIDAVAKNYLTKNNYFDKKAKNKPSIFLVEVKEEKTKSPDGATTNVLKLKKIYNIKNPEKFMFAYNNKLKKSELTNREVIANEIATNMTLYSVISTKIDNKNASITRKITRTCYNGTLNLFVCIPKLGFGYIINPMFNWLKTDTASDTYKNISSEVEKLSTGDKEQLPVKCFQQNIENL